MADGAGSWDAAAAAAADRYASAPGVKVAVTAVGEPGLFSGFSQFTFGASTQLILFMFLTSMTAAARLVYSRQLGVSRRMVSTPTSAWTIVTGEALGRFGIAMLQAAYIVVMTAVAFGVSWGDPLAAGAIIILFGIVAAGAAMLVGATSRNADQASSMGVFLGLALGALGGCMIPFQTMPAGMQAIARFIPHSWALLGLQELIRTGGGIDTVGPEPARADRLRGGPHGPGRLAVPEGDHGVALKVALDARPGASSNEVVERCGKLPGVASAALCATARWTTSRLEGYPSRRIDHLSIPKGLLNSRGPPAGDARPRR